MSTDIHEDPPRLGGNSDVEWFTAEVEARAAPLLARIAELERELASRAVTVNQVEAQKIIRRLESKVAFLEDELKHASVAKAALERDLANAEVELRVKRSRIKQVEKERDKRDRADPAYETAFKIWEFWRKKCAPRARKFSHEDFKAVKERLADTLDDGVEPAYGPRYICEAILGAAVEPSINRESGKVYNSLELICRSPKKLEDFHERWERYCLRHGIPLPTPANTGQIKNENGHSGGPELNGRKPEPAQAELGV